MPSFADLGVPDDLRKTLASRAIAEAFPIQAVTIPHALAGRDVCGRAPTGSGKTLAFGIPLVATVERARPKRPRGLVLVPTRELAAQVAKDLTWLGAGRDVRVHAFYGGVRFDSQIKALRRGVDIAVACPGRLADLINQHLIRLDGVDRVVIDEADRMADMGFLPEVMRLLDQTDPSRQVLLFSATLDGDVDELIKRYQHDPAREDVTPATSNVQLTHHFWSTKAADRVATTAAIVEKMGSTIVFTRTRHGADRVARQLETAGISAVAIHGNRSQNQRERALKDFTGGRANAMVATDVAARGIHVDAVECVVHFDLPADPKDYVHRSGRTGRAGKAGVVVALIPPEKRKDATRLARNLDLDVAVSAVDLATLPAPSTPVRSTTINPTRDRRTDRSRRGRPAQTRRSEAPRSDRFAETGVDAAPRRNRNHRVERDDRPPRRNGGTTSDKASRASTRTDGRKPRARSGGPNAEGRDTTNWRDDRRSRPTSATSRRDDRRTDRSPRDDRADGGRAPADRTPRTRTTDKPVSARRANGSKANRSNGRPKSASNGKPKSGRNSQKRARTGGGR